MAFLVPSQLLLLLLNPMVGNVCVESKIRLALTSVASVATKRPQNHPLHGSVVHVGVETMKHGFGSVWVAEHKNNYCNLTGRARRFVPVIYWTTLEVVVNVKLL